MTEKKQLSNLWLKASVLGCFWASSEIVIGSFLHNLRIPFCGNILTAIGIIIMVSVGQIWTERGLFWRTGLVCALMKSISPSAIIFGPMLGIFSEALLMELCTFVFRKSIITFLIGGALAMSWNLVQVLLGYVITYGSSIVSLYEKLTEMFQHQLGIVSQNFWWPIEIILIFYLAGGLLAAAIGLYIGRVARKKEIVNTIEADNSKNIYKTQSSQLQGTFSLWLLLLNIILIIAALTVFNLRKLPVTILVVGVLAIFWIIKYPKVLRPLKKPGFWIFMIITTILSAYLFTSLSTGKSNGWIIGVEMNLRAIVMILGFAVVGRELRNPVVGKWLHGIGFKQLPYALELAFESLPAVISNMPGWKEITRNPIASFSSYIYKADKLLELHERNHNNLQKIIIITGERSEGKTTFLKNIISIFKAEEQGIQGFLSLAIFENETKIGYNLLNISDNKEMKFISENESQGMIKFRKYYFSNDAIAYGNNILMSYSNTNDILIIDEIGPWELEGGGWFEGINMLTKFSRYKMIWVVRKEILDDVIKKWDLINPVIIDVSKTTISEAKEIILNF